MLLMLLQKPPTQSDELSHDSPFLCDSGIDPREFIAYLIHLIHRKPGEIRVLGKHQQLLVSRSTCISRLVVTVEHPVRSLSERKACRIPDTS